MHLMVGVWLLFASLLFVVEPLTMQHAVRERHQAPLWVTITRLLWMHRLLLALSLIAIFAAVGGSRRMF
jgi:hypothetical protein